MPNYGVRCPECEALNGHHQPHCSLTSFEWRLTISEPHLNLLASRGWEWSSVTDRQLQGFIDWKKNAVRGCQRINDHQLRGEKPNPHLVAIRLAFQMKAMKHR
jgi:hypothetical protein